MNSLLQRCWREQTLLVVLLLLVIRKSFCAKIKTKRIVQDRVRELFPKYRLKRFRMINSKPGKVTVKSFSEEVYLDTLTKAFIELRESPVNGLTADFPNKKDHFLIISR